MNHTNWTKGFKPVKWYSSNLEMPVGMNTVIKDDDGRFVLTFRNENFEFMKVKLDKTDAEFLIEDLIKATNVRHSQVERWLNERNKL